MRPRRDLLIVFGLAVLGLGAMRADGEPTAAPSRGGNPLDLGEFGKRKEPIIITSNNLEYDYKTNVVVYHGDVHATQGPVKLQSDTLTITFEKSNQDALGQLSKGDPPKSDPPKGDPPKGDAAKSDPSKGDSPTSNPRLHEIVAAGHVRMDDGTRTATSGRAVFEQSARTVVLTENPVLHEGTNEVVGDRVIVYLDENRSVVEGGRKRVKAVLYPSKDGGLAPAGTKKEGDAPGKQGKQEEARVGPEAAAGAPAHAPAGGASP
jgi:lipopolysaccharide export system protein LptA